MGVVPPVTKPKYLGPECPGDKAGHKVSNNNFVVVFNPNPTVGNVEGRTESACIIIVEVELTGREGSAMAREEMESWTRESCERKVSIPIGKENSITLYSVNLITS